MKTSHLFIVLSTAILVGCASHIAKTEVFSGRDFLLQLHQQGQLPGDSKDARGILTCYLLPSDLQHISYPLSRTYHIILTGSTDTNNYTIIRPTKDSGWQLQRAWRTDSTGRVIDEWPVK